ncbi:MAG: hypothetical protein ACYC5O_12575 [Anaerolineae bacterium]
MGSTEAKGERAADLARKDLAGRLGTGLEAIRVVSIEAKRWNDAGLGCPEPGKVYLQAMVDGFRLILETGGRRYDYRSDGRRVRLCERG